MAGSNQELDSELESFRQQWLSDLRSRGGTQRRSSGPSVQPSSSDAQKAAPPTSTRKAARPGEADDDYFEAPSFDYPPQPSERTLANADATAPKELVSALDHFEQAMVREAQGNMGDSLSLYRKAYKLDNGVDRRYREKHFPGSFHRPGQHHRSQPSSSRPPQQQPIAEDKSQPQPQSITDLLDSFSALTIEPVPPEVEGMPQPPCPIASLPEELLVHIMQDVAIQDIADFSRLSLVCRRLAYLVSTEQRIWRRISVGSEFGFAAMHHHFGLKLDWTPHDEGEVTALGDGTVITARDQRIRRAADHALLTSSLVPTAAYPTWRTLFRNRPRIRFNGCYISTVNYVRPGMASTNQATWGSNPIHIVTYYRYLRFFRDGSVISLLSTEEPNDVVHHLTKEEIQLHRERAHNRPTIAPSNPPAVPAVLPTPFMSLAHKGRWRLSSPLVQDKKDEADEVEEEGNLYIETEGVGPKYTYRMDLALRSAGKGARNNKVVWRSFHSYNKLTDDWAEFSLKHDKPFFFSRVKSYGFGEI